MSSSPFAFLSLSKKKKGKKEREREREREREGARSTEKDRDHGRHRSRSRPRAPASTHLPTFTLPTSLTTESFFKESGKQGVVGFVLVPVATESEIAKVVTAVAQAAHQDRDSTTSSSTSSASSAASSAAPTPVHSKRVPGRDRLGSQVALDESPLLASLSSRPALPVASPGGRPLSPPPRAHSPSPLAGGRSTPPPPRSSSPSPSSPTGPISLLTWGFGKNGRLASASRANAPLPTVPAPASTIPPLATAVAVAAAGQATFVLFHPDADSPGGCAVAGWGNGDGGVLGNGDPTLRDGLTPVPLALPTVGEAWGEVRRIRAGFYHGAVFDEFGRCRVWGRNDHGALGVGGTDAVAIPTPMLIKDDDGKELPLVDAGIGGNQSIYLDARGGLHAAGVFWDGRLGLGPGIVEDVTIPRPIRAAVSFTSVSCGWNHTLALAEGGIAYAFGKNSYGQLGVGGTDARDTPVPVERLAGLTVTSVEAGGLHSAFVANGALFTCGASRAGQLGHGDGGKHPCQVAPENASPETILAGTDVSRCARNGVHIQCEPRRVTALPGTVRHVACGSQHTIVALGDNRVFAFGDGEYGVLGNGSNKSSSTPSPVTLPDGAHVAQLAAGFMHSAVLLDPPVDGRAAADFVAGGVKSLHTAQSSRVTQLAASVGSDLSDDASAVAASFFSAYQAVDSQTMKAAILVSGQTGVGKSAIINSVFGEQIAFVGAGRPVTQHFLMYEPKSKPIIIYDSRGLEYGHHEEFIAETRAFLFDHSLANKGEPQDVVHVVWYVIDASTARLQPFEAEVCRTVLQHFPVLVLINKCDLVERDELDSLRRAIEEQHLPNLQGIIEVVTVERGMRTKDEAPRPVQFCPKCGSDDVIFRRKRHLLVCDECGNEHDVRSPIGLDEIVDRTNALLPELARQSFVTAQALRNEDRRVEAARIIRDGKERLLTLTRADDVRMCVAQLVTAISLLWNFKSHSEVYGAAMASAVNGHRRSGSGGGIRALSRSGDSSVTRHDTSDLHVSLLTRIAQALGLGSAKRGDQLRAVAITVLWASCLDYTSSAITKHLVEVDGELTAEGDEDVPVAELQERRAAEEAAFAAECASVTFRDYFTIDRVEELAVRLEGEGIEAVLNAAWMEEA